MKENPTQLNEILKHRKINYEFLSGLELLTDYFEEARDKKPTELVTDSDLPPMPGHYARFSQDPRLKYVLGSNDEKIMAVLLAKIWHRPSKRIFLVYRDTIDALYAESQDLNKYPIWLMEDQRKQNERSIRISEMTRVPSDKHDKNWLGDLENSTYDTLVYFLYLKRTNRDG